jgi:hypothetical protein
MHANNLLLDTELNILRSESDGGSRLPAALLFQLRVVLANDRRAVIFKPYHLGPELGDGYQPRRARVGSSAPTVDVGL